MFETLLPLPMYIGVALSGGAVLVGSWAAGVAAAPDSVSVPPTSSVGAVGENYGPSG